MLWTAPPLGAEAPRNRLPLRRLRFGGGDDAGDYDSRSRYCEVGVPGSLHRCPRHGGSAPAATARQSAANVWETATLPRWDRGLRLLASLGTRTAGARPYRPPDAAGLRQTLC